jgi:hypothetical protein
MLYVKNVVPAMSAMVNTNKPMYIHIFRAFFGLAACWHAIASVTLRHHLLMILPFISPYRYYIDKFKWK